MFPFSRLQKALLAVGSFSCLGLNSGVETDVVKNDAYELKVSCTKFNIIYIIRNLTVRTHLKCLYSHQ